MKKQEGHYTIKRFETLEKLPKKGNANWLYLLENGGTYLWKPGEKGYESINVGNSALEDSSGASSQDTKEYYEKIAFDNTTLSNDESHSSEAHNVIKDGIIYQAYRFSPEFGHVANGSQARLRTSSDNGSTWSDSSLIYEQTDRDIRNYVFGEINGVLFLFFREYNADTSESIDSLYTKSTDNGVTWSTPVIVSDLLEVIGRIPFGKIITNGSDYFVSYYSQGEGACWIKTSDNGTTWVSDGLKYDGTVLGGDAAEPYFDFVNDTTVFCLVRDNSSSTPNATHQLISTDGGATFGASSETNLNNGVFLKSAPYFHYDKVNDLFLTIACTRADVYSDKILVYANTLSEVLNSSTNYRIVSEQLAKIRYNTQLYGYPSVVNTINNEYFISYTERYKDEEGVEQAFIYQSYIHANLDTDHPLSKDEGNRVLNYYGIAESRKDDDFQVNKQSLLKITGNDRLSWEAAANRDYKDYGLGGFVLVSNGDINNLGLNTGFYLCVDCDNSPNSTGTGNNRYFVMQLGNGSVSSIARQVAYDFYTTDVFTRKDNSGAWVRSSGGFTGTKTIQGTDYVYDNGLLQS